jgi:CheY-like chemotaxis protein
LARRILLADDSVTAQNMGRRILTDAGYEVVTVNNGSAALKKIAENKPDLIVLDVYMPGYGGLEVCQRVKENPETKQIPVLLTVGKLEPFKAEEARRVGADSFIIKPFEATELLTLLTKLEDKIVAQPQPQKSGRFAKALAVVEQSDKGDRFGDKETGWKNRLTIPVPHAKPAASEEAPEAAATAVGSEFRGAEQPEAAAEGFERPIPAGLPADITPEEIAAITAAAAAFGGKVDQPPAISGPSVSEPSVSAPRVADAVASQQVASPAVATAQSVEAETPSTPETIASAETVRAQDHQVPDVPIAENQVVRSQVAENQVSESQIAEDHVAENLIQAGQTEQQPVSAEQSVATNSEASAEAQISQPAPTAAGDAEVMAAIASLSPGNGSNGTGHEAPAAAYTSTAFSEVVRGPRWIAEPVDLALEESKLALDQEMDQVHAARATADAVSLSAALANSSTVAVAEPVEPAIAAQTNVTKSATTTELPSSVIAAEANVVESGISQPLVSDPGVSELAVNTSVVSESGVTEPKTNEATTAEASTAYDQTPLAAEASAYAAAASAGAGSEYAAPVEVVSATTSVPENRVIHQPENAPQREAELAAAWQNWKQIRESFAGSQPASAAADAPANEAPVESPSKQEEAAVSSQSTSADAVAEPVDAEEEASDAPEESTVIASMVDNMLAELRPKLVAEIAKKMNSEKKEKEKEKKKKK